LKPLYSICITNYNNVNSVRQSLDSILRQIDERFEVVVIDNRSTDGSLAILGEYQRRRMIKLVTTECSRGLGRQIGVKLSRGKYIISQMDMDDVFEPKLKALIEIYHNHFEGNMLLVSGVPGLMIAPRQLVEEIGGYRDLNYLEDKDLYSRAARLKRFRFLQEFKIVALSVKPDKLTSRLLVSAKKEYFIFRESFRIGYGFAQLMYFLRLRLFSTENSCFLPFDLAFAFWGLTTHKFYQCYRNDFVNTFNVNYFKAKLTIPNCR